MTEEISWLKAEDKENGLITQTMIWPKDYWPVEVQAGSEKYVFRRSWKTTLAEEVGIIRIWTFIGVDCGDIVEADIEVYSRQGTPLVLRSKHKEIPSDYDAWKPYDINANIVTRRLRVALTCRAGRNTILDNRYYARVHYGIIVIGQKIYNL